MIGTGGQTASGGHPPTTFPLPSGGSGPVDSGAGGSFGGASETGGAPAVDSGVASDAFPVDAGAPPPPVLDASDCATGAPCDYRVWSLQATASPPTSWGSDWTLALDVSGGPAFCAYPYVWPLPLPRNELRPVVETGISNAIDCLAATEVGVVRLVAEHSGDPQFVLGEAVWSSGVFAGHAVRYIETVGSSSFALVGR